ncbi:bifunctional hydroxymethylpyrimidine kinase/phosphomethylpyrimidine kinase [Altererythrobacter sp. H2]|uniref:bifunctional hydroxymethylpyrimidine kinase/phosphomethylpyrimidine kinase n=1 Tax=Altererythrobacter sp. H2 TaxID=3108391 RepID=UPI000BC765BF|nr:bifunctional hydroxymethylpyrimidine kinase/phosphomethylpyrimidine kinase [Altererythrobacter sp. H2]OZA93433.1 MAG: bifunctional hydroxymethylpyrimidine kinase/phosphomethylpyrimidine kinase [Erythrobacter sp. 34-65-8]WRK96156.1 bifunctional hydroxymethylpyrimidine kinase/phosphomethylpyrimidine kinase [Altererythrobacter sp. H2]
MSTTPPPPPRILSIAGSDSSGGAGIQADIKTIAMLGGYAMTAVTTVTAQNTVGVQAIAPLSADVVAAQISSCASDIGVDAIKIGMLHDVQIITAVAGCLTGEAALAGPVVLDPVMVATSGAVLIAPDAIAALKAHLFPLATVITPNLPELEHLCGRTLRTTALMQEGAAELAAQYGCHVLAKGGHTEDARIIDLLVAPDGTPVFYEHARIETRHTHGTGCTLSSAIATLIGHGQPLDQAVRLARQFVLRAIEAAPGFGAGNGPLGHQAVRR